jgi:hypothetical protein
MKLGVLQKRHEEFYDRSKYKSIHEGLEIYETTHEGDRCIITWSKSRQERDQKDGFFGIITNVKNFSAKEIIGYYKHLWIIEDAFGEIKGTLKTRPVFHWTDRRIVGHLTLCFLAYFCEAQMTKILREKNMILQSPAKEVRSAEPNLPVIDEEIIEQRPLPVVESIRELCEVRAIPVQIRGKTIWVRTDINGNAAKIFHALGIKIPPRLLKFEKNEQNGVAQKIPSP